MTVLKFEVLHNIIPNISQAQDASAVINKCDEIEVHLVNDESTLEKSKVI